VKKTAPTKSQLVYEGIRRMILTGQLSESATWSIRTLAVRFNMSMVPVYGAIRRLEQEGILVVRPKSGIRVRKLSTAEIREAFVVREGLEVQAVRILAKKTDEKVLFELSKKARQISRLIQVRKFQQAVIADFEWHLFLIRSAECAILTKIYDQLSTLCMLTFKTWDAKKVEREQSKPHVLHMKLVDAIRSGNANKAEIAVRHHIRSYASSPG